MSPIEEFTNSIKTAELPPDLPPHVQALWFDAVGNWKTAHGIIDQLSDADSAYVHAYLHRKEGDNWNADYWYRRAGKQRPAISLEEEWKQLVNLYLGVENKNK